MARPPLDDAAQALSTTAFAVIIRDRHGRIAKRHVFLGLESARRIARRARGGGRRCEIVRVRLEAVEEVAA